MKTKSIAGPVVTIVLGGIFGLFALFGLLRAAAVSASYDADAASVGGSFAGVLLFGALSAVALTLGIRAIRRARS